VGFRDESGAPGLTRTPQPPPSPPPSARSSIPQVSSSLAAVLILALDLQSGYHGVATLEELERIAQGVANRSETERSASLETLRLQVVVLEEYIRQQQALTAENEEFEHRVERLQEDLAMATAVERDGKEVYGALYMQIVVFLKTACRVPPGSKAEIELRAVLDSVMPLHSLRRFVAMSFKERSQHLEEVMHIVLGICWFNLSQGQGGQMVRGHPSFSDHLARSSSLIQEVSEKMNSIGEHIEMFTDTAASRGTRLKPHAEDVVTLRDILVNLWQHHRALDTIKHDMTAGAAKGKKMHQQTLALVEELKSTIGEMKAVSKEVVYPLFIELGQVYSEVAKEDRMLTFHESILAVLKKSQDHFLPETSMKEITEERLLTMGEKINVDILVATPADPEESERAAGVKRKMYDGPASLPTMSMGGFCPVTIVKRNGILVPIDPSHGYLEYKDRLYGCASKDELNEFAASPEEYLKETHLIVKKTPELIALLNLEDDFPGNTVLRAVELMKDPLGCEFGVQCPTHFVEKHIDPQYDWNEWSLRRKALQLANIRQKKTHSMQTDASHFRRDTETQVYHMKTSSTNTAVNKGQSMPRKVKYVQGLRGGPDVQVNVVTLDLDLGQPHEF